jgi:hypothetical protein
MIYTDILEARLKEYRTRQITDDIICPAEPFLELDWSQDHRPYFRDLVTHKIVTKKQVEDATSKARQRDRLARALGSAPATPLDFVGLYAAKLGVSVTYKGAIRAPGRDTYSILDFARGARLTAGELGITYGRDAINDAIEEHYQDARSAALATVRQSISTRRSFDWLKLVDTCFSEDSGTLEFRVAVLRKLVWQVKRKLQGLPVTFPLMPVLSGLQGSGKSWFVQAFTKPIVDLVSWSDFGALADDRNIDLWRSYLIVLDEMAKAAKADTETIKHVITADHLERRPMRTNSTVTIRQNATFIATTNLSLGEIITDPTGARRFCELHWVQPPRGFLDQFDFHAAWCSIQAEDADPMARHMTELAQRQAETRNRGPVESWLTSLDDEDRRNLWEVSEDGFIPTLTLWNSYLAHRATVNGGSETMMERRTLNSFSQELSRLTQGQDYGLCRHRKARASGYLLTHPATVQK